MPLLVDLLTSETLLDAIDIADFVFSLAESSPGAPSVFIGVAAVDN